MNYLAPSILSADFSNLGNDISVAVTAGAQIVHLDVMDGKFVPNISFGAPVISSIRKITNAIFDVHLMIEEPIRYLEDFKKAGADIITVHYEACQDVQKTLDQIRAYGIKVGLSISPDTPVSAIESFISSVDMILVMSVYPGFGGQKFIDNSIQKIESVSTLIQSSDNQNIWIEVDGGIGVENIERIKEAGANVFVAGSSVFKGNIATNVSQLLQLIK